MQVLWSERSGNCCKRRRDTKVVNLSDIWRTYEELLQPCGKSYPDVCPPNPFPVMDNCTGGRKQRCPSVFQKMHANGDDFVIVDLRGQANIISRDIARRLGDRNRGIGFNQLAVMSDCDDAAVRLTFWNPDGSTLDACGSATRGAAWKLLQEADSSSVIIRTNRGLLTCSNETDGLISVDMGKPFLL